MLDLLIIAIRYSIVSNVILSQFLGICPFLGVSKKTEASKGMSGAVLFVILIASIITHLIYVGLLSASSPLCKALGISDGLEFLNTLVFILVIASLVQFVEMFLKKNMPSLYESLGVYLPLITTNCAVLGVSINSVSYGYNLIESVVYGLGISVGFAIALILMSTIRENIIDENTMKIPRAFQGSPIVLITSCLMAIAFMGFSGLI